MALISFLLTYEDKKCTDIKQFDNDKEALKAFNEAMDAGKDVMIVDALSREDLERDAAHRIGGELGPDGDGMMYDTGDHDTIEPDEEPAAESA